MAPRRLAITVLFFASHFQIPFENDLESNSYAAFMTRSELVKITIFPYCLMIFFGNYFRLFVRLHKSIWTICRKQEISIDIAHKKSIMTLLNRFRNNGGGGVER